MLLYWQNTNSNWDWEDTGNWWEDAGATTNHGALPASGDSCTLTTGEPNSPAIGDSINVDLGAGVCDILGIECCGTISGGTFTGNFLQSFTSGAITGGTFTGNYNGTWNGGTISGGTWTGSGFSNYPGCTISGGVWTGSGFSNSGTISGGVWVQNGTIIVNGVSVTGGGNSNPGFPVGVSSGDVPVGNIVAAEYVLSGHSNYTGGDAGTLTLPAASDVWHAASAYGVGGSGSTPSKVASSITNCTAANVADGVSIDDVTGTLQSGIDPGDIVAAADVRHGTPRYPGGGNGTCYVPAAADVRHGTNVDATTGACCVPTTAETLYGVSVDVSGTGTVTLPNTDGHTPNAALVLSTAHFGAGNADQGTAAAAMTPQQIADALKLAPSAGDPAAGSAMARLADKTGFKLAADGLDLVSTAPPAGVAGDFREMLVQLWRRFFRRAVLDHGAGTLATYADDGATVTTTQAVSETATTETQEAAQ